MVEILSLILCVSTLYIIIFHSSVYTTKHPIAIYRKIIQVEVLYKLNLKRLTENDQE